MTYPQIIFGLCLVMLSSSCSMGATTHTNDKCYCEVSTSSNWIEHPTPGIINPDADLLIYDKDRQIYLSVVNNHGADEANFSEADFNSYKIGALMSLAMKMGSNDKDIVKQLAGLSSVKLPYDVQFSGNSTIGPAQVIATIFKRYPDLYTVMVWTPSKNFDQNKNEMIKILNAVQAK